MRVSLEKLDNTYVTLGNASILSFSCLELFLMSACVHVGFVRWCPQSSTLNYLSISYHISVILLACVPAYML